MKTTNRARLAAALILPCFLGFSAGAIAAPPSENETRLLAALQKAHPGTHFTTVSRTPIPGLFEVWMGSNVAFVSNRTLRYLLFGRMFDTKNMTDLTATKLALAERLRMETQERDDAAPVVPIGQFPLTDAIKTVHGNGGNGSRSMAVFSDPACPYCKRLEPELDKLDNVTIYTFLVPFQGYALPTAIWCAADRQKAWHQTMQGGDRDKVAETDMPATSTSCAHPLDRNLALAQRLKIRGTPTIIFANGRRIDGHADAAEIESGIKADTRVADAKTDPALATSRSHATAPRGKETAQ